MKESKRWKDWRKKKTQHSGHCRHVFPGVLREGLSKSLSAWKKTNPLGPETVKQWTGANEAQITAQITFSETYAVNDELQSIWGLIIVISRLKISIWNVTYSVLLIRKVSQKSRVKHVFSSLLIKFLFARGRNTICHLIHFWIRRKLSYSGL